MIEEARRKHLAMVVVGVAFVIAFLAIAAATVVSVTSDPIPEPATVAALTLPPGIEVVDAHQNCNAEACDGEGAVLRSEGMTAAAALVMVEDRLKGAGWWEHRCGDAGPCLRWRDLGAELVPWVAVDDEPATAAMRANLDGMEVDQSSLVYLRVFRCDVVTPCG
ncbi:MAG TPA: hypothetical protein VJA44_06650 [Acidimicrobiia bacterium]|uniref:Uncharacterized protein n=1 Tax=uncultured actinobacterium Rifle_16ft_4_minimus_2010 TaxID=1665146 RepID=A0A0H4T1U6_9ACTN|nr:hypothetical protein [uncultured actinobacterium Rifle_16ft_4_minimus_2010]HLE39314.1 hypothetical protein [Acidimicrobiia bacterium]